MTLPVITLLLVPAFDEPLWSTPARQNELEWFCRVAGIDGGAATPPGAGMETGGYRGGVTGKFRVSLADLCKPGLASAVIDWFGRGAGRAAHLGLGGFHVEMCTPEDVEPAFEEARREYVLSRRQEPRDE
ncbi:hypothetical protein [Paraburkholderia sp. GAS334]|jgi:hypothetical protein|uniref:hypothetical protein n=1 Tax=Paraburkholderia sp. GAS334 TaxID=3035131 RepID=UPI003D21F72C